MRGRILCLVAASLVALTAGEAKGPLLDFPEPAHPPPSTPTPVNTPKGDMPIWGIQGPWQGAHQGTQTTTHGYKDPKGDMPFWGIQGPYQGGDQGTPTPKHGYKEPKGDMPIWGFPGSGPHPPIQGCYHIGVVAKANRLFAGNYVRLIIFTNILYIYDINAPI